MNNPMGFAALRPATATFNIKHEHLLFGIFDNVQRGRRQAMQNAKCSMNLQSAASKVAMDSVVSSPMAPATAILSIEH
jgi:hypothetical protein